MLVLSRKAHQGIWIGDDVFITVLRIERGRVKLGIEAPANVQVDRDEVRASCHAEEGLPESQASL